MSCPSGQGGLWGCAPTRLCMCAACLFACTPPTPYLCGGPHLHSLGLDTRRAGSPTRRSRVRPVRVGSSAQNASAAANDAGATSSSHQHQHQHQQQQLGSPRVEWLARVSAGRSVLVPPPQFPCSLHLAAFACRCTAAHASIHTPNPAPPPKEDVHHDESYADGPSGNGVPDHWRSFSEAAAAAARSGHSGSSSAAAAPPSLSGRRLLTHQDSQVSGLQTVAGGSSARPAADGQVRCGWLSARRGCPGAGLCRIAS
jgi:hypothetical protein